MANYKVCGHCTNFVQPGNNNHSYCRITSLGIERDTMECIQGYFSLSKPKEPMDRDAKELAYYRAKYPHPYDYELE